MQVAVTGATGFIGTRLCGRLLAGGHRVVAIVRDADAARRRLGEEVELRSGEPPAAAIAGCDAVINLAGAPIAQRWTRRHTRAVVESRVDRTRALVQAMVAAEPRPRVLVSASAVDYYGERGDEELPESAEPGTGPLADLCRAWEAEARAAETAGVRVAVLRTGVVLGRGGGVLAKILLPFSLGLGGSVGSGHQFMPWIHLHDVVELYATALEDPRIHGPINAVAGSIRFSDFARTLGRVLHRPSAIPVPAFAVRAVLGQGAEVALASKRVVPARLAQLGIALAFPELEAALADAVSAGTRA